MIIFLPKILTIAKACIYIFYLVYLIIKQMIQEQQQNRNQPPPNQHPNRQDNRERERQLERRQRERDQTIANNSQLFCFILFFIQIVVIILFAVVGELEASNGQESQMQIYFFAIISLFILIGLGFLHTLSKDYPWSALATTFLAWVLGIELYILSKPFWNNLFPSDAVLKVSVAAMVESCYGIVAVLVAYGAVMGQFRSSQMLIILTVGMVFYSLNMGLMESLWRDGNYRNVTVTMSTHLYGGVYGLAVSSIVRCRSQHDCPTIKSNYLSTIVAFFGTGFIMALFPLFNFAPADPSYHSRICLNTVLCLGGSLSASLLTSALLRKKDREEHKIHMSDIMNVGPVGGVVMGSCGYVRNYGVGLGIGLVIGTLATIAYVKIPRHCWKIRDTKGVLSSHVIPGLLGGLLSFVILSNKGFYCLKDCSSESQTIYQTNAINQIWAILISIGLAIGAGIIASLFIFCSTVRGFVPLLSISQQLKDFHFMRIPDVYRKDQHPILTQIQEMMEEEEEERLNRRNNQANE